MTAETFACSTTLTSKSSHGSSKNNKNIDAPSSSIITPGAGQTSPNGQSASTNAATIQNRECIQIVSFFHRKTAETACLEARLAKNQVTRVCVIRPNSVFYTLSESLSRKLYCCLATRDNAAHAGKPIFTCRKSIVEVKQDALVVLFYDHGVLFVPFSELNAKFNPKLSEKAQMNNSTDDLSFRSNRTSDPGLGRSCSMLDFTSEVPPIRADYWNPSTTSIKRVQAEAFEPSMSDQHLRGYCLSHDRTVVFAMYGNTVYRLSGTGCAPLASIEVPIDMDSTFRVMFLGRITVLQGDTMTAAYLNSNKPAKILHKNYRSAGFGFVWDETGVYQIRMCNPVEMPDDLQADIMAYSTAYRTADTVGRAISGEQLTTETCAPGPMFQFDAQKHLASPALLSIAGAYTSTNEDVAEKFMKAARTGWQHIDDFNGGRSKLGTFRRLDNIRRKLKVVH
ncbi:uncharacterized protein LOC111270021 isoform X2 [Varroa jacobsoni]|uniref:Uncharacterized protein n=1 Tax=Varroa destructor TaxID=109461 RepID=A0A7M7ME27_VARDE|nr:uncharacterized protein LOC111247916 isoform X2 [Varroa destructor]XP_022705751.1 uncharacterized protein LOC111270021 isoform X2 [Varroa jacobsoni]